MKVNIRVATLLTFTVPSLARGLHSLSERDDTLQALNDILGGGSYTEATKFESCTTKSAWFAPCNGKGDQLVACLCTSETAVNGINACLKTDVGEARAAELFGKFQAQCGSSSETSSPGSPTPSSTPQSAAELSYSRTGLSGIAVGLFLTMSGVM